MVFSAAMIDARVRALAMGVGTLLLVLLVSLMSSASGQDQPPLRRVGGSLTKMSCNGAPLCGVLALETGDGSGYYKHKHPVVHGLWPQVPPYGTSPCIPPRSDRPRSPGLPSCYNVDVKNPDHQQWFVDHEWEKHGVCAGAPSADEFFGQVCALSGRPLSVMYMVQHEAKSLDDYVNALNRIGFSVYSTMDDGQILLSACAKEVAQGIYVWFLAAVSDFPKVCGQ